MKKQFLYIMMLAGLTACTNDDNIVTEVPTTQAETPVYQVSISAGFDDGAQTRAVSIDGTGKMIATFKTTDDIHVYNKTKKISARDNNYNAKLLHPNADGATAKLVGNLTFYGYPNYQTVDENDVLVLINNASGKNDYNAHSLGVYPQSGTLACLNLFDFAWCEVSVNGISGAGTADDPYTLTTSKADFVNAQSMFKFTFTGLPSGVGVKTVTIHSAGNKLISYYCPYVDDDTGDVTIDFESSIADGYGDANARRQANGPGVVYAALRFLPLGSGETDDITFTVTGSDGNTYKATKTSPVGGFQNGKYYTSTIAVHPFIDLAAVTENTTVPNGYTLTGKLGGNYKISIADGATVTLDGVTINGTYDNSYQWAGITCEGDATIILSGTNTVKGFKSDRPGIYVPTGKTLTIQGTGSLNASSNGRAAGIGGGYEIACGNITITGGTVTATGGNDAAGIGGGCNAISGNITIANTVTRVTATKGTNAPCSIGKGFNPPGGTCGTVTIGGTNYGDGVTDSPFTYTPPTP
ncbi:MAG: hypothetical protein K6E67_12145 [Prevotella sp.]|nr:hypothetical protein [Prevotella sp.]